MACAAVCEADLSTHERRLVLKTVLDATDLPLVVGCTSLGTAPVIDEARMATELAGDRLAGVMVQANTVDPAILRAHLAAVNAATGAPIVVQDHPMASGVSVPATVLAEVATLPFIAAVKAEAPRTHTSCR